MSEEVTPTTPPPADPSQDGPAPGCHAETPADPERRGFLGSLSSLAMAGGLAAGYGTFGCFAARYLYPAHAAATGWMFVCEVGRIAPGEALAYKLPDGAKVVIARQGSSGAAEDFVALSSVCPHLGCQVHWEGQNSRFFCPCHNGTFDPSGNPTGGPPKEPLPRYPLKVEDGLLFIEVPLEGLA
ncbi:MAG: Rieske (2Fe-2S) protein [Planctomycetes bacterium]|nr:Rieske (2Fe-2S) protein [Planctomycetota bacterium]